MPAKKAIAKVNVHWEGQLVEAGQPIPSTWPQEYVTDLVKTGGARREK